MQNGGFGWANSLSSSLAAQKVSWSEIGYQTSLTDLFLKKNPLHFNTGISQLAVASSYLEKMSNFGPGHHVVEHHDSHTHQDHHQHHSHQQHHHSQTQIQMKCPHPESKNKPGPCELCQEYQTLCLPHPGSKSSSVNSTPGDLSSQSNIDKSIHGQSSLHHSHLQPQPGHSSSVNLQHLPNNAVGASGMNLLHSSIGLNRRNSSSNSNFPRNNNSSTSRSGNTSASNNKTFMCPVCHRNFTQKGNLKTHMMIHSGDKPYACQVCGKSFTQKGNVDTHMKIHTGEKDQNCQLCGKRFTQRGNLRTHMRSVHTKEKPHSCGICGKSFSQKGNMMTHLRTHNKEDRFPCTLCGKTFSQKGNLKTHMQRHSGTLPARRYGPRAKKSQAGSSTAVAPLFASGNPSTSRETVVRSNLKSTDDDSASSLDRPAHEPQLSHDVVHLANQHLLNQHRTATSAAAQMGMQFSPRFYPQSSTMSAPLAHTASWLAAAGASAVAGIAGPKGRMAAPPYESFSLTSYGFQHPSSLGRLSLLNAPSHHPDHQGNHEEQLAASHHKSSRGASSTVTTSGSSSTTNQSSHTSHEYTQNQPNPDFSQLLDQ